MRILLVEDALPLRDALANSLIDDGHVIDCAGDGAEALGFIGGYNYEIVVLDLMLPRIDGLTVLRKLRESGRDSRVLVLSARDHVNDRVQALNLGADDYLVKPFAIDELRARINALSRRALSHGEMRLLVGDLEVDTSIRLAKAHGEPLALSPKEYALLEALVRERGRVHSRQSLFERIYDSKSEASDRVVEVLISTLRAKLVRAGLKDIIETRRGYGYLVS